MKRIGSSTGLIFILLLTWVFGGCSKAENDPVSPLLADGAKWFSEDKAYSLRFPKSWEVNPLPFAIAMDPNSKASVSFQLQSGMQAKTEEEMLQELRNQATSNAPPTLGSSRIEQLHQGAGKLAGYPAAWSALGFDDRQLGLRLNMAYAIGTPKGIVVIGFMMVPRDQFDQLRPVFEAIAQSLKVY